MQPKGGILTLVHESDDLTPLSLIGRTRDGERLTLTDEFGNHFTLEIDDQVRTAVNAPVLKLTTSGAVEYADESDAPLTPKLIQQRIRFGESVQEIASATGTNIDSIERFAGPVLLEREHIADQARQTLMRKGAPEDHTLGNMVTERLAQRGITSAAWDAWKREDGCWSVSVTYPSNEGTTTATWVLDLPRRTLITDNDTARWLTGDDRSPIEKVAKPNTGVVPNKREKREPAPRLRPVSDTLPLDEGSKRDGVTRRASVPSWDDIMFGKADE
jgi:hypothetical protein